METIRNTWVEKIKKKKEHETAPSYDRDPLADTYAHNAKKPKKRFSKPAISSYIRSLRGIRK